MKYKIKREYCAQNMPVLGEMGGDKEKGATWKGGKLEHTLAHSKYLRGSRISTVLFPGKWDVYLGSS
jgi:hypothetical protein